MRSSMFLRTFSQYGLKDCPFFILLLTAFITTGLQAQTEYEILVDMGNNGTDNPLMIQMIGTLGETPDLFQLDNPGKDDNNRNTSNRFVYRSDRDLGDITNIAFKGSNQDYAKIDRVKIKKLGTYPDGNPYFQAEWTTFNKEITGKQSAFKRADNIATPSVRMTGQNRRVKIGQFVRVNDNLNGLPNSDESCVSQPKTSTYSTGISLDKSTSTSVTNSFSVSLSADLKGIASFETAYSLEVNNSFERSVGEVEGSESTESWDLPICAKPGMITFVVVDEMEIRDFGESTWLNGKVNFYKTKGVEYPNTKSYYRTYKEVEKYLANPSSDPELDRLVQMSKIELKNRRPGLTPISFGGETESTQTQPPRPSDNPNPVTEQNPAVTQTPPAGLPDNFAGVTTQNLGTIEVVNSKGELTGYYELDGHSQQWTRMDVNYNVVNIYQEIRKAGATVVLRDNNNQNCVLNLNTKQVLVSVPGSNSMQVEGFIMNAYAMAMEETEGTNNHSAYSSNGDAYSTGSNWNGLEVEEVEYANAEGEVLGYFTMTMEDAKSWKEMDAEGNAKRTFQEIKREGTTVHLKNQRDGVIIYLNLDSKEVQYSDRNNTTPFTIYYISDAY